MTIEPNNPRHDEDDARYRDILHDVLDRAARIAQIIETQIIEAQATKTQVAEPDSIGPAPAEGPDRTIQFDRVTRIIRRTIILARSLREPPRAPKAGNAQSPSPGSVDPRTRARKRIIRDVENGINDAAAPGDADSLRAEFQDRLDSPDLDDDIATRPVAEIVAEIMADLGVGFICGRRRTPEQAEAIASRAAEPSIPGPREPREGRKPPKPNQPHTREDDIALLHHLLSAPKPPKRSSA